MYMMSGQTVLKPQDQLDELMRRLGNIEEFAADKAALLQKLARTAKLAIAAMYEVDIKSLDLPELMSAVLTLDAVTIKDIKVDPTAIATLQQLIDMAGTSQASNEPDDGFEPGPEIVAVMLEKLTT
jgi:hypothetical protein